MESQLMKVVFIIKHYHFISQDSLKKERERQTHTSQLLHTIKSVNVNV